MVKLTFYGGVNEIGGNKILLEGTSTKMFLDFGLSFGRHKKFYDKYLQARSFALIDEYIAFDLLPKIKGLYREDHLKHIDSNHSLLGSGGAKSVDAVLISHAHIDHIGLIPYLRPDIGLLGSETTLAIINYLHDTMGGDAQEFLDWYESFKHVPKKRGEGLKRATRADLEDEKKTREYTRLTQGQGYELDSWTIETYAVDHSLPGANAYIIKTSSGNIAYTGDLRLHGYHSERTEEYIRALETTDIKVLLCEGTRINEPPGMKEDELKAKLISTIDGAKGSVLVNYPARDTSRIRTLAEAASACDRKLLINPKQAYYLSKLSDLSDVTLSSDNKMGILLPLKSWGLWGDSHYSKDQQLKDYSNAFNSKAVRKFVLQLSDLVLPQDIARAQSEYVVTCSFYEISLLHDIQPGPNSVYISSKSSPYDMEGVLEEKRWNQWLEHFNLGKPVELHCSGHISGEEIKDLVEKTQPEKVVPIHTNDAKAFKKMFDNTVLMNPLDSLTI